MQNKPQQYRVYPGGLGYYNKSGYKVLRSIIDGEDYGETGDLVAYIPEGRDMARFLAKYLNERDSSHD